jgi:hypothetical protein
LTFNKPKPTIQKITFSKEDQENIDLLLAGRPTKKAAAGLERRGINIDNWIRGKSPPTKEYRMNKVKQQYYKSGFCGLCDQLPTHRVYYDMDGATLVEVYCLEHFKQYFPDELA